MADALDIKLLESFRKKAHVFPWKCMAPKCKKTAISSHVLQKNGVLSTIAKDRHLIEAKPVTMWELNENSATNFSKIGINDAFTFPGFCSEHDNSIFKNIEKKELDFTDYGVQLLFSYRGLCQEIRRKQIVKSFLNQAIKYSSEFKTIVISENFEDLRDGLDAGVRNLNHFKSLIEEDLKKQKESFNFWTISRPLAEICTSAPLNIKEPNESDQGNDFNTYAEYKKKNLRERNATTFVNIFPSDLNSIWIVGEHREYPSTYTKELLGNNWQQILTDLIALRMEYWCMSEKFYLEQ
ncbi:MAG TPA: hypothetical protein VF455_05065, partial [Chryseobacterium sp.]